MHFQCRDISFHYPGTDTHVFKNLAFSIDTPGFHALFGPSGVGKTSLARMVSGELSEHGGKIITDGLDTLLYSYNLERLPGWSSIGTHLTKITPPEMLETAHELVDFFKIGDCMRKRFGQLSLGQKNRINLIRYLVQDFQLLIMDESLANVDELTREKIILKIKAMFPDRLFLYISHNVIEVSKFCRDILVLRGVHKQPQVLGIQGQDHMEGRSLEKARLEKTMLEIMNAA
jgi:ABC-type multidrug transport system ATPase subunit